MDTNTIIVSGNLTRDPEYAECKNIQDVLKLWGATEVERLYQLIQRESTVDSEVF